MSKELWPSLQWSEWKESAMTVHLFTQIIGKIRLALMPMQAEWQQVPLTVTSRGLASTGMPLSNGSLDIAFDFISHSINFNLSNGKTISFQLKNHSVAEFYNEVMNSLKELDVDVTIKPVSVEMKEHIHMDKDNEHKSYDSEAINKWWHLLVMISNTFNIFRSKFSGKETPVNFYWGTFDLAMTFFSGKLVEPQPGQDLIYRVGADAEQIEIGFWPGNDEAPDPAFFAFAYPKPEGLEGSMIQPSSAKWSIEKGEFLLPYESIRHDPEKSILDFCESTYRAGATLARWDTATLEHKPPLKKL